MTKANATGPYEYPVSVGDTVQHIKEASLVGTIWHIDTNLQHPTTCNVTWHGDEDHEATEDVVWTNKLIKVDTEDGYSGKVFRYIFGGPGPDITTLFVKSVVGDKAHCYDLNFKFDIEVVLDKLIPIDFLYKHEEESLQEYLEDVNDKA